jgi:hypothetical protein
MIIFPLPGESREDFLRRYDETAKRLGYPETPPEWRKLFLDPQEERSSPWPTSRRTTKKTKKTKKKS